VGRTRYRRSKHCEAWTTTRLDSGMGRGVQT
jgi:hypothetical protein